MSDPIASASKGVTSALIEYLTENGVKKLADQFRKGDLKIIIDTETYQVIKEQKKAPELLLFKRYVLLYNN